MKSVNQNGMNDFHRYLVLIFLKQKRKLCLRKILITETIL